MRPTVALGIAGAVLGAAMADRNPGSAPSTGAALAAPGLCEASAALTAPWDPALVLVADNEVEDRLFAFLLDGERLVFRSVVPLPTEGRPHDTEALASLGSRLLVVGSHGPSKRGEAKPKRARMAVYAPRGPAGALRLVRAFDDAARLGAIRRDPAACLARLFVDPPPREAAALCRALAEAPLQIEGAATLAAEGSDAPSVWLGLRTPLLDGHAVLLRLVGGLEELRFDAVTRLDLGGRGVRELAPAGGTLGGIAGATADGGPPSRLWRVPRVALVDGVVLEPEWGAEVPPEAEGLVVLEAGALVVIDRERSGGGDAPCTEPARQLFVRWPVAPASRR